MMNENIKSIARLVGIYQLERFNTVNGSNQLEEFAKLIAMECALQCIHSEDMDLIEKHFGAEK